MIKLKNVSKFYYSKGVIASGISKVNLDLDVGEFVVITGESGSGKSTLLNVISGLDTYEEGEMYVFGHETSHYTATDFEAYRKKYIGNIFQNFNLVSSYTVAQNVALALEINASPQKEIKAKVAEILERVGMADYAKTKVSKLSGGQKQRVAIARALAKDTKIIVADEPTGNLDSESAAGIVTLLAELAKDRLVIVVTHNFDQFKDQATRIIKMHDGRIVEDSGIKTASERAFREAEEAAGIAMPQVAEEPTPAKPEVAAEEAPKEPVAPVQPQEPAAEEAPQDWKSKTLFGGAATPLGSADASVKTEPAASIGDAMETLADEWAPTPEELAPEQAPAKSADEDMARYTQGDELDLSAASIRYGDQVRLGIRNTFNIIPKFLLLLLVFLFVVSSVTSQYVSVKRMQDITGDIGYNNYFENYNPNRIILERPDRAPFTQEDYDKIATVEDVEKVIRDDMVMDSQAYIENDNFSFYGYLMNLQVLTDTEKKLTYGAMPTAEQPNGVVLSAPHEDYFSFYLQEAEGDEGAVEEFGAEELIGKEYEIESYHGYKTKVVITGILVDTPPADQEEGMAGGGMYGSEGAMYVSDNMMLEVRKFNNAYFSQTTALVNKQLIHCNSEGDTNNEIVPSTKVAQGKILVPADYNEMYNDGKVVKKKWSFKVTNGFYTQDLVLEVADTYTKSNFKAKTGLDKYDNHAGQIYMNPADYDTLFSRGNYQTSVYAKSSRTIDQVKKDLQDLGYDVMALRDHQESWFDMEILPMLQTPFAVLVVVVVFFIAYFVIRLILKSRGSYFAILRMLGMQKKNARHIMNVELVLVSAIAYVIYMAFIMLARQGYINNTNLQDTILYMKPWDYGILAAVVFVMALLISGRFVRSVFKKSAMDTYREEA